jgi:hypothetical protein
VTIDDYQDVFGNTGDAVAPKTALTQISNWADLDNVRNDLDGNYLLTNNLNQASPGYSTVVDTPTDGLEPIGDRGGSEFTGVFFGDGYDISDLVINRSTEQDVGLFGATEGATIEDVGLTNADISGDDVVGGIVARSGNTTLTNVYANGTVAGNTSSIGGVAGDLNGGSITESFSAGTVDGENATSVGGVVGLATSGDVFSSYSLSDVSGDDRIGGVVGDMRTEQKFENPDAVVDRSYAAGSVTATAVEPDIGGLVGSLSGTGGGITANLTNSYWDEQSTGQADAFGSNNFGFGVVIENNQNLTTSEMQGSSATSNMTELDFVNTWAVDVNPDDYPILQAIDNTVQP